jgi:hypothetical protein
LESNEGLVGPEERSRKIDYLLTLVNKMFIRLFFQTDSLPQITQGNIKAENVPASWRLKDTNWIVLRFMVYDNRIDNDS